MTHRVVITGIGMVSPLGLDTESSWAGLLAGRSGITRISRFDTAEYSCRIAAEVKGFDPLNWIDKKEVKKMDLFIQYGVAAAHMALTDSGLKITPENENDTGVMIGSGIGGLPMIEEQHKLLLERGPRRTTPFFIPGIIVNMVSGQVSIMTGAKGPNSATCTACATSSHAIGDAYEIIKRGDATAMIAGGAESVVTPLAIAGFGAMRALSTRNDEPEKASRPFDLGRDGFILGEGAAVLILEERETALKRGARIYAELIGYGLTGDAYHMTAPCEDGSGARRAMQMAMRKSGRPLESVDYINAHGTSTPQGDKLETLAIKQVFGEHAKKLAVNSTKSMTGHLLGAAGALEAAVCILAIRDQVAPPTINLDAPDPACDLDYVPNVKRAMKIDVAMSNSFGFGGTNACLVFAKHA
jgi:3-oxoacyl-[acyl-carrier-protein] synthase II